MKQLRRLGQLEIKVFQTGDWQFFWIAMIILWCAGVAVGKSTPDKLLALIPPYGIYKGVELFLIKLGILL